MLDSILFTTTTSESSATLIAGFTMSVVFCLVLASVLINKDYRYKDKQRIYYIFVIGCSLYLIICTPLITGILAIPIAFVIAYFAKNNNAMLKFFVNKKYLQNQIDENKEA